MDQQRWIGIVVTVVVSVLLLLVEHYWPWHGIFQRKLHQVTNYVLGTLALIVPQTVAFALWGLWDAVWVVWLTAPAGGLAVMGAYCLDGWIALRTRLKIAETENNAWREVNDDQGQKAA